MTDMSNFLFTPFELRKLRLAGLRKTVQVALFDTVKTQIGGLLQCKEAFDYRFAVYYISKMRPSVACVGQRYSMSA
jgi:hypothetical protein